ALSMDVGVPLCSSCPPVKEESCASAFDTDSDPDPDFDTLRCSADCSETLGAKREAQSAES
ncbi:MAG: hypothetical protein RI897_3470, partial [Verrucomicrobiota bacterium]